jgi:hypothetical protein
MLKKQGNDVILCCNGVKCPVVRDVGNEKIQIKDDDGNKIVITKEQANLIPDALKQL